MRARPKGKRAWTTESVLLLEYNVASIAGIQNLFKNTP